jgi:hypothetical protein
LLLSPPPLSDSLSPATSFTPTSHFPAGSAPPPELGLSESGRESNHLV